VVLLIAMVAAIALTFRDRRGNKSQDVAAQVRVKRNDRLKIVKMDAEEVISNSELAPQTANDSAPSVTK